MPKKLIIVTVTLLFATVQALAVNCDLRCSMMAISAGCHGCGSHGSTDSDHGTLKQCHGMTVSSGKSGNSASSRGNCETSVCKAQLEAVVKKSTGDESPSKSFAMSTHAETIHFFDVPTLIRSSLHRSSERLNTSAPLELRPGSSLRI